MDRRAFLKHASASVLSLATWAPLRAHAGENDACKPAAPALPTNWTWGRIPQDQKRTDTARYFEEIAAAGIQGILLGGKITDEALALAKKNAIQVHAWRWTLCRRGELLKEHPDWYVVSRNGDSAAKKPPYVPYYRFLCPSREEVVEHLVKDYVEVAARDGLAGVHLDYVRYPDVILPRGLWAKYDLVQDKEHPEFDFCYCTVCREAFRRQEGVDPLELPDPPANEAWRQYRYDTVTRLVNRIADAVHAKGSVVTAAVFPTPAIARRLVRQDWTRWKIDALMPMVYHHFYEQDVAWIEKAVREGVAGLAGARPLFPGLYLPSLKKDDDYAKAVEAARAGGASGIALFGGVRKIPKA
jgi:uncharacterized lipoprotein YddW (UPF0748 family)